MITVDLPERSTRSQLDQVVGILGGMGPAATNDFYQKLIEATPATRDQDHLPVVIWSDPRIPDRTTALLDGGPDPTPWIRNGICRLRDLGCTIIAMPCNSAHAFVHDWIEHLGIDFVDMITATVSRVTAVTPIPRAIGLLATSGTIESRTYADGFRTRNIPVIVPNPAEQKSVMSLIHRVKANRHGPAEAHQLMTIIQALRDRGADAVILGCTELPLIANPSDAAVFDPTRILAETVVAHALSHALPRKS